MTSIAQRQAQSAQPSTSQIATPTRTQTETSSPAILRLRGAHSNGRSVQWRSDVVDNEGLGRKKSKVCCIYHRPKGVDESSDDTSSSSSDSSSSSNSDSDPEPDQDKKITSGGGSGGRGHRHSHNHDHDRREGGCNHDHGRGRKHGNKGKKTERRPSPNAYEKMPKYKPKDGGAGPSNSEPQGPGGSK